MIDTTLRELRQAARRLVKAPVFSVTAVVIIGLGIGANAAMFTFVDAVLVRPQPFARPAELVDVYQDSDDGEPSSSSFPAYRDIAAHAEIFSGAAAIMPFNATLMNDDGVESVAVEYVTSNYFDVLGLAPTVRSGVSAAGGRGWRRAGGDREPSRLARAIRQRSGDPGEKGAPGGLTDHHRRHRPSRLHRHHARLQARLVAFAVDHALHDGRIRCHNAGSPRRPLVHRQGAARRKYIRLPRRRLRWMPWRRGWQPSSRR